MNPDLRRHLNAIGLAEEHDRLTRFLEALVYAAVRAYGNEFLGEAWDKVQRCAEIYVHDCADRGVFAWFGIRDRADLIAIPPLLYPGEVRGQIVPDVVALTQAILGRGSRQRWLRPRDLEFTGKGR